MSEYLKLVNLADERGEEPAKVARTLVRLGCDLYLHFGPSRKARSGVSFFPEHPNGGMEHNIGPGDHPLTKDSQEVVIKRLGRVDYSTLGLFVLIYTKVDSSITVPYQIELMEEDDSVCVVVSPDDIHKLPPLPKTFEGANIQIGEAPAKNKFQKSENNYRKNKKSNPEIHKIFWRAFVHLRESGFDPQYKQVWETVYNELRTENRLMEKRTIPPKRKLDPHDHIEVIDPVNVPAPKLQWIISGSDSRISNQGTYSLLSLAPLLSKLKKNPPKI